MNNAAVRDELIRAARTLKVLSQLTTNEEISFFEPGQLSDAVYSVAEHLDRIAEYAAP